MAIGKEDLVLRELRVAELPLEESVPARPIGSAPAGRPVRGSSREGARSVGRRSRLPLEGGDSKGAAMRRAAQQIQRVWRGTLARRRFFVVPRLKIRPAQFDEMLVFPAPGRSRRGRPARFRDSGPAPPPPIAEVLVPPAAEPKLALADAAGIAPPPGPPPAAAPRRRFIREEQSVFTASTPESEEVRWLAAQKLAQSAVSAALDPQAAE